MVPDVGALVLRARKETIRQLVEAGATGPDAAVALLPQRHMERRALGYLVDRGVVVVTEDGRYWVSETRAAEWQRQMRTRIAIIAGSALALGAAAFAITRSRKAN